MEQSNTVDSLFRYFPLLFLVGWLAISAFLSRAGGWQDLAKRYASQAAIAGKRFWFTSLLTGSSSFPVRYSSCLFVSVGRQGIRISPLFLFRFMHPPLVIPWSAIESVTEDEGRALTYTGVQIRGFQYKLRFPRGVGQSILDFQNRTPNTA
jgi:hypothetical protein